MKKWLEYLIVFILLLPLMWVYTPSTHDWGGDFAAYIAQAENIIQGTSTGRTGYVYNPEYFRLAPPFYPPGFSLTLAPVIALLGSDIETLILVMSAWLILFGLLFYRFLRFNFNQSVSLAGLLLVIYNPWMLRFKAEVIADLPFATLVLAVVVSYKLASKRPVLLLLTLTTGVLAILTKTHGMVLIAAFFLVALDKFRRKKTADASKALGLTAAIGTLSVQMNRLWSRGAENFDHFSKIASEEGGYFSSAWPNFIEYLDVYRAFFIKDVGAFSVVAILTSWALLMAAFVGTFVRWRKGLHLGDWVFLGLMATLIFFPITNGFRYLLPAFPFFFSYSISGLSVLINRMPAFKLWSPWLGLVFLGTQYINGWGKIADLPDIPEGPYREVYAPLHHKIQELDSTASNALFIAAKPRVFAYMNHILGASVHPNAGTFEPQKIEYENSYGLVLNKGISSIYIISIRSTPHVTIDAFEGTLIAQDSTSNPPKWTIREWERF